MCTFQVQHWEMLPYSASALPQPYAKHILGGATNKLAASPAKYSPYISVSVSFGVLLGTPINSWECLVKDYSTYRKS